MMLVHALTPWNFSPSIALGLVLGAVAYARGSSRVATSIWQRWFFWSGMAVVYLTLLTRFDYYAEHEFFIGEIESAMLQHVAAFLIALAAPVAALRAGLPAAVFARGGMSKITSYCARAIYFLQHPAVTLIIFNGVIVFWLLPRPHFLAMIDWKLYRLMNWSMFLSGLLFWSAAFDRSGRYSAAARIALLLAAIPIQIAAGALLFFSPRDFYPVYTLCGRALAGVPALQDQHIGGLVIWIHGAMMSGIGVLIVSVRAWRAQDNI